MNFNKFQLITISIIIFALLTPNFQTIAVSNETGISLQVTAPPVCNNNGICEPGLGENSVNCPLDCPLLPFPGGGVYDTTPPVIYNLLISEITLNSAKISWKTDEFALCQLFWGKTQEYELETIIEAAFNKQHSTKLINLFSATTYHFKISCRDPAKNESETTDQKFSTLALPDITPPANVLNFEAIAGDEKIELKWQNPPDLDFKAVKIMRSTSFYPSDPWSGTQVYNQKGTSFIDSGLTNGVRYYYTAFAYDKAGNHSSGAIASAIPYALGVPPVIPPVVPPVVPPEEVPSEIEGLTLEDFDFWQEQKKLPLLNGKTIEAKTEIPLTISINYEKVPEVLKTIMITLKRGEKVFSFLLRIDKEKIRYLATLIPPDVGDYPLNINVLDFKNQALKGIPGELITKEIEVITPKIPWYKQIKIWLYILIGLLILAGIMYLIRKSKEKSQKEEIKKKLIETNGNL